MYGDVNIVQGNYNFSLQQIIHKDFKIRDGSTINFRGDPFNAHMDINAIYNLTAISETWIRVSYKKVLEQTYPSIAS